MTLCRSKDDGQFMVLVLYITVSLGAFLCIFMNVIFAFKWHTQLDPEFRALLMPRLTAVVVSSVSISRSMRLVQVWLWYHGSRLDASVCFVIEGIVAFVGVYGTLMALLTIKLDSSFRGSIYAVKSKEIKILYSLITAAVIVQCLISTVNSIGQIRSTQAGQMTVAIGAVMAFIFNVTVLAKLNFGFASRLRTLVAMSSVSNGSVAHTGSPVSPYPSRSDNRLTLQRKPSLAEMKHSSVNAYETSHRRLLRTAAKSLVLAVWISVAFMIYTMAVLFNVNGDCADLTMIIAQILGIFPNVLISAVLTLTLPHSEKEYRMFCTHCDRFLQTIIAWQTTRQVVELTRQRTHSQNSQTR